MSQANKSLIRRMVEECIIKGNFGHIEELIGSDYVYNEPTVGEVRGQGGYKQLIMGYRTAFPDLQFSIDEQIAEGDRVVTCWTATGTQNGELFGIKPTGKRCTVQGILVSRIADGKVVEEHESWDVHGMLRQLGAAPANIKLAVRL